MFEKTARLKEGRSDMVVPWLQGFVHEMGSKRALFLLQGAGLVTPKTRDQSKATA